MGEFAPKLENQPPEFSEANARQFLSWMFPRYSAELVAEIPEVYLPTLFNVLEQNARTRWSELPKSRRKKQLLAPLGLVKPWVEGLTFDRIADQSGENVDSIKFRLISYAEKTGRLEDLGDLLATCETAMVLTDSAVAEQPETLEIIVAQEEIPAQPQVSPEPVFEPDVEIEIEQAAAEPEPQPEPAPAPEEPEPLLETEVPQDEPAEDGEVDQAMLDELARHWNNT